MVSAPARLLCSSTARKPDHGKHTRPLRARLIMVSAPARLFVIARRTKDVFRGREKVACHTSTIDSTWSSCKAYVPSSLPSCSPHLLLYVKVLAAALCLAPVRCGAANCRSDRKDVKKEKAGNGRYNLRFASAKRKTPLKLSPLFGRFVGDSMCVSLR